MMRLALSSAAAPDATFDELLAACARRGFAAVELEVGHAHGVSPEAGPAAALAVAVQATNAGIGIAALRLDDVAAIADPRTPRLAVALGAPVVIRIGGQAARSDGEATSFRGGTAGFDGDAVSLVRSAARRFAEAGATLLLACRGDAAEIESMRLLAEAAPGTLGLAWDVAPGDPGLRIPGAVLAAADDQIRHIRLHGGGPESIGQEGLGLGRLMSALALSGYSGALALAPSDRRYRYAWSAWLGRRGGWGCGSKAGSDMVVLETEVEQR